MSLNISIIMRMKAEKFSKILKKVKNFIQSRKTETAAIMRKKIAGGEITTERQSIITNNMTSAAEIMSKKFQMNEGMRKYFFPCSMNCFNSM